MCFSEVMKYCNTGRIVKTPKEPKPVENKSLKFIEKIKRQQQIEEFEEEEQANIQIPEPEPSRNVNNPYVYLDLHYMTVRIAEEMFIKEIILARKLNYSTIVAVTGKGLHSYDNKPVIKNKIIDYCEKNDIEYQEDPENPGRLICYLSNIVNDV